MIRLEDLELPAETARRLVGWQSELDAIANYDDKVQAAIQAFEQRSRSTAFAPVRETLARMCSGLVRCGYCEDSHGNQVEHIWPKSWYPERAFVWRNLLLSCAICNGRKHARFAIVRGEALHELVRRRDKPRSPPPTGAPALIDPRREDPLDYFEIDLRDTFLVLPRQGIDDHGRRRADYTIDLLGLNEREVLVESRAQACESYALRTARYASLDPDTPRDRRDYFLSELGRLRHRMVWEEMKRSPDLVEGLRQQLAAAPELRSV